MDALTEVLPVRQIPGEPLRRWFASKNFDLIVWFDESAVPLGFQLCYDKPRAEHALTWKRDAGFTHMAVDDGEGEPGLHYKGVPILVPDGRFDPHRALAQFLAASRLLPGDLVQLVETRLQQHPSWRATTN